VRTKCQVAHGSLESVDGAAERGLRKVEAFFLGDYVICTRVQMQGHTRGIMRGVQALKVYAAELWRCRRRKLKGADAMDPWDERRLSAGVQ
jgi:hypothetical protein